jgi:hypothetical protein
MIAPQFGNVCSEPQDGMLANRLSIWMSKIENSISTNKIDSLKKSCKAEVWDEKVEPCIYYPHEQHTLDLIVVIVDDLGKITVMIEQVETIDVKLYLREWYYLLKEAMCSHPDAIAYHSSKKAYPLQR